MRASKIGLLLTNLGSPDAPTPAALRRYLAEFLWDERVVDLPRPLWWFILHGVILRVRPSRSARLYEKVWTREGAPLLVLARKQKAAIAAELKARGHALQVALGMRYGTPSIATALRELSSAGCQRIIVLPLYPQNSCSTTGSTFDAVADELRHWRDVPELRFVADYHDERGYIDALAASIRDARSNRAPAERLIFSFHGTPERFRAEGDLYYDQCRVTAQAVAARLNLDPAKWQVSFQSRFGREEWLKPYTDETLRTLGNAGLPSVEVICPGFSADCLETLEEIAVENRKIFQQAGGGEFHYIPALNERPDHIHALVQLVEANLGGW